MKPANTTPERKIEVSDFDALTRPKIASRMCACRRVIIGLNKKMNAALLAGDVSKAKEISRQVGEFVKEISNLDYQY